MPFSLHTGNSTLGRWWPYAQADDWTCIRQPSWQKMKHEITNHWWWINAVLPERIPWRTRGSGYLDTITEQRATEERALTFSSLFLSPFSPLLLSDFFFSTTSVRSRSQTFTLLFSSKFLHPIASQLLSVFLNGLLSFPKTQGYTDYGRSARQP